MTAENAQLRDRHSKVWPDSQCSWHVIAIVDAQDVAVNAAAATTVVQQWTQVPHA